MTVDWDVLREFISAITPLITAIAAIGAVVSSLRNSDKLKTIKIELNDRLSQLIERTKGEAFLDGRLHERTENGNGKP